MQQTAVPGSTTPQPPQPPVPRGGFKLRFPLPRFPQSDFPASAFKFVMFAIAYTQTPQPFDIDLEGVEGLTFPEMKTESPKTAAKVKITIKIGFVVITITFE